jgi:malate dehydrogenase (oxaloacetate-decarboxylating)
VKQELPHACLQWEDFATPHARPILDRYRNELLTFNDDIQGTAAVALGAVLAAVKAAWKTTGKTLRDQQVVFLGAGSASIGVADYLRDAMIAEGLSGAEAVDRFWIVDKDGLLRAARADVTREQRVYARPDGPNWGLAEVIGAVDASILIGLSTARGAFTEPIVREMARKALIILPLSNPTERSDRGRPDPMD